MAKSQTIKISYKGSVKPNKTPFLTPAEIEMDFEIDLDLEDSDIANAKTVQKERNRNAAQDTAFSTEQMAARER